jgi:tetratricopeptide (TPR) repeat protein
MVGARFFRNVVPMQWLAVALGVVALGDLLLRGLTWMSGSPADWSSAPNGNRGGLLILGVAGSFALLSPGPIGSAALQWTMGVAILAASAAAIVVGGSPIVLFPGIAAAVCGLASRVVRPVFGNFPICAGLSFASVAGGALLGGSTPTNVWSLPERWSGFRFVGAGFGTLPLLRTDGPPQDQPLGALASLVAEGGWVAVVLLGLGLLLFAEALSQTVRRDRDGSAVFGPVGLSASVGLLGFWAAGGALSPSVLLAGSVALGGLLGRAAFVTRDRVFGPYITIPAYFPHQALGVTLLAVTIWAGSRLPWANAFGAASPSELSKTERDLEALDAAIFRLRPQAAAGDAVALAQVAERRIARFRAQTAALLEKQLRLDPDSAWRQSDPAELFARARALVASDRSRELALLRNETPVAQNLPQARAEVASALKASPLLADVALRAAQLRFLADRPVNAQALLDLAGERGPADAEFLYRLGVEESFADRLDRAAVCWQASLAKSMDRLVPIVRLAVAKFGVEKTLQQILPNHPEAHLTLAELAIPADRAMDRILAFEFARKALDAAPLGKAEKHFHAARLAAGGGRVAEAVAEFRQAVEAEPNNLRYRATLARALDVSGDRPAALREAEECLKLAPADAEAKSLVERLKKAPADPPKPPTAPPAKK